MLLYFFPSGSDDHENPAGAAKKKRLQKFIFSATLTLPKSFKREGKEKKITREEGLGNAQLLVI